MTNHEADQERLPAVEPERPFFMRRAVLVVSGLLLVVAAVALGSAFLPRWWAQRIGDQVNGNMGTGIALGLFYGFVFVALPLLVLRFTFRKRRSLKAIGWSLLVAVVLAAPNLVTLSIVVGTGNAAHAGERILDVEGPGFRYSTLAGAILAAAAWLGIEYLLISRRRVRRRLDRLSRERDAEAAPGAAAAVPVDAGEQPAP